MTMHEAIAQQLGAAVGALEGAIRAFPDDAWTKGEPWHRPWYVAFHTLFWLDLYLSESSDYQPPAPFTASERESDVYPDHAYSKTELLDYAEHGRTSLRARIETVTTAEGRARICRLHWGTMRADELLLYNLRHVQHHVGQLNLMIRLAGGNPAPWFMRQDGLTPRTAGD